MPNIKTIKYLTQDELKRLFNVIDSKRDKAIFLLAYRHGLRISEIGMLRNSDVNFSTGRIMIERLKNSQGGEHPLQVDELKALVKRPDILALPLYLYDHSGLTMATIPFSCPWDSGQVGCIVVGTEKVLKEWKRKKMSKGLRKKAFTVLQGEVETYDQYLRGEVYGYEIEKDGEFQDSCWGYFGDPQEYMLSECKRIIDECYIPKAEDKAVAMEVMR